MSGYALANTNEPADELHQLVPTAIERGDVPGDAVAPAAVSTDEQAAAEPAEEGRLNLWAKARGGVAGGTAALGPARPSDDHPGTYTRLADRDLEHEHEHEHQTRSSLGVAETRSSLSAANLHAICGEGAHKMC